MSKRRFLTLAVAAAAAFAGLFWSGTFTPDRPQQLVNEAKAWIGRPATPMSFAGVARRTTRRAVMFR